MSDRAGHRWVVQAFGRRAGSEVVLEVARGEVSVSARSARLDAAAVRRLVMSLRDALDVLGEVSASSSRAASRTLAPQSGPMRLGSVPVMPAHLHDGWCGWPTRVSRPDRPDLAHCAGCGLFVRELGDSGREPSGRVDDDSWPPFAPGLADAPRHPEEPNSSG